MVVTTAIIAAYLLGGLNAGYYIVRWRSGEDLRETGSGSTGGTNAARVLGRWGRVVVGGLDVAKGAAIVLAGHLLDLGSPALGVVVFAAVLGNIFPLQLGFRGGKGIGTSLGALVVYSPATVAVICALTVVLSLVTSRQQVSGVVAYAAAAISAPWLVPVGASALAILSTCSLVIVANRVNFAEDLKLARQAPPT